MHIYKFTKAEYAIDILENERLYLSTPNSFNDPFDCFVSADDSEIRKAADLITEFYDFKELFDYFSTSTTDVKDEKVGKILERGRNLKTTLSFYPFYKKWDDFYKYRIYSEPVTNQRTSNKVVLVRRYLSDFQKTHLICCFSKIYDSILMWSHYAEKHTGVCFEFDVGLDEKDMVEVNYRKDKVEFKILNVVSHILALEFLNKPYDSTNQQFNKEVMEPLYTKSTDWKYEQEVRYILPIRFSDRVFKDKNNYYIKSPHIKSVIIGCRADKNSEAIKRIITLANKKSIQVKYAKADDHQFALNIS